MKLKRIFGLLFFCTLLSLVNSVKAQIGIVDREAETKPSLMVVGSYHFENPGRDIVKTAVTDVSTPERQKQLDEFVKKLEKFKPTKIVLECGTDNSAKFQENFSKYLAGDYKLLIDERDQIGFRLAKNLGHKQIYCVDWNEEAPGNDSDYNYVEYAGKDKKQDEFLKKTFKNFQDEADKRNKWFIKASILDQFIYLNNPVQIERDHAGYFDIARIGNGKDYIGANWLASYWYGRNLKIFLNIIRITDSSKDKILAVYGAGHLKLLNQFATESGFYNVESPLKYLKK